jgi:hypothetical protein
MSTRNFIHDGTGKGFSAKVDSSNRLRTFSVTLSEYDFVTARGRAFNVNTRNLTPASSSETPVFYLKNDSEDAILIEAWFFGVGGPQTGSPAANTPSVIAVYPSPAAVTGGVDVPIINRSMKDPYAFQLIAKKHDAGTPLQVNGSSTPSASDLGEPVLWQYQSNGVGSRAFGVVHLQIPAGQWVVVTVEFTGTLIAPVYTGFTGYVEEDF